MTGAPVFVVGTGRCGSTLLSDIFNTHPDVLSISEIFRTLGSSAFSFHQITGQQFWRLLAEPGPGLKFLNKEFGSLPPILHVTLPHLSGDSHILFRELESVVPYWPLQSMEKHYRQLFNWLRDRLGKGLWVERSGASLVHVSRLMTGFPDARFVHLYRDGRDVAISIQQHTKMRMYVQGWRRVRRFGINALRSPFIMGENPVYRWLEPAAFRFVDVKRMREAPLPVAEAGRFWAELITTGMSKLEELPAERRLDISFESLVSDPRGELERLSAFVFDGRVESQWLDQVSLMPRATPSRWQSLGNEEQVQLIAACKPGLESLGYC